MPAPHHLFSVYAFSDLEIERICELLRNRWNGKANHRCVDMRKLSQQVRLYAVSWKLLEWQRDRLIYTANHYDVQASSIPAECLWRVASEIIITHQGVNDGSNLVADPRWSNFCIPCQRIAPLSEQSIDRMKAILFRLSQSGYITFGCAGGIWNVQLARVIEKENEVLCQ